VSSPPAIGLLGGTGIEGKGLALRFAQAGVRVTIGSRAAERATATARALNQQLGRELIAAATNPQMIEASELVFLTVPFVQAAAALDAYRDCFRPGSIVVDVTVPIRSKTTPGPGDLPEGSGSQHLAKRLPGGVALVGAFKTIPAHLLAALHLPLDCDVFVCSDSEEARARVMGVAQLIPTLRPVDAGGLGAAGALERMTALAVHLNRRYNIRSARFRVVGL